MSLPIDAEIARHAAATFLRGSCLGADLGPSGGAGWVDRGSGGRQADWVVVGHLVVQGPDGGDSPKCAYVCVANRIRRRQGLDDAPPGPEAGLDSDETAFLVAHQRA